MNKIARIVLCVGLAACSQKKEQEGREPVQTAPAPASGAAPGSAAAPGPAATPAGTSAAETARAAPGGATIPTPEACASPSKLSCAAGQVDGCTGGLTSVHLCVAADARAGSPCAQGAALTCPSEMIDACGFTPPYASNHICVVVPRPAP